MFEEKNWEPEFSERLARHYDELKWLYAELYHNDQQAFEYFCGMLHDYYVQRSDALKQWDQMREEETGWYKGNDMLGICTPTALPARSRVSASTWTIWRNAALTTFT